MSDFKNPVAEKDEPDSGRLIKPGDAYKVRSVFKYFCPDHDCPDLQRRLMVKESKNENYFFSHFPGYGHDIGPETLLHKAAIQWFLGRVEYELPPNRFRDKILTRQVVNLDASKTLCEFRRLQTIVPDVKLEAVNGFEFAVEVFVTNDISEEKVKKIAEFKLPTIRVNLSHFYIKYPEECRTDFEFVKERLEVLMTDIKLKSWVVAPEYEMSKDKLDYATVKADTGCAAILVGLGLLLIITGLIS